MATGAMKLEITGERTSRITQVWIPYTPRNKQYSQLSASVGSTSVDSINHGRIIFWNRDLNSGLWGSFLKHYVLLPLIWTSKLASRILDITFFLTERACQSPSNRALLMPDQPELNICPLLSQSLLKGNQIMFFEYSVT